MAEFKHWVSYFYAYNGDIKGKNVGFVKIDVREGKCRLYICLKGVYGFEQKGLAVNLFVRRNGRPEKLLIGQMRLRDGCGEFAASTNAENLFGTGERLLTSGGIWLCGGEKDTIYLTSWEKSCLDIHDFLPKPPMGTPTQIPGQGNGRSQSAGRISGQGSKEAGQKFRREEGEAADRRRAGEEGETADRRKSGQEERSADRQSFTEEGQPAKEEAWAAGYPEEAPAAEDYEEERGGTSDRQSYDAAENREAEELQVSIQETAAASQRRLPASLWENLCRYYPKAAPELAAEGIQLLQIRPSDIRYLPRRLWHLGSNSFLLHGYYRYKHLVLGRLVKTGAYILGVRGNQEEREKFSASLFGFHHFLPVNRDGTIGYWYMPITMDNEEGANISEEEKAESEADSYM